MTAMALDGRAVSRSALVKTYDAGRISRATKTPISTEIGSRMKAATMKSMTAMQSVFGTR